MNRAQETKLAVQVEVLVHWYEQMQTIRAFDESVVDLFNQGAFGGSTHPSIAQEAIAVGACAALQPEDLVLATYRGHGICIAKGADPKPLMGEILCRSTDCCKGRGGSMHLWDVSRGVLGTNAIVAAHIPIAGGVALACRLRGTGQVTLCFFGDGAACEGEFFETLNLSALWRVPLVLICENNEYAISVHVSKSQATPDIADRAQGFGMRHAIVDGNDVCAVYEHVSRAVGEARAGGGPSLIECKTVRWERHSAFSSGRYENPEAAKRWRQVDPIPRFERQLLAAGISQERLDELRGRAKTIVQEAVEFARVFPTAHRAKPPGRHIRR
jgi:acetoin:2,6-dichlorophenolindophenol oxidoreductase subunit alpha